MKSRIEGNKYIVRLSEDGEIIRVNRQRTDKTLNRLLKEIESIRQEIEDIYDNQYELYRIMDRTLLDAVYFDQEEKARPLKRICDNIRELQAQFATHGDEIPEKQYKMTLYDMGYRLRGGSNNEWELIIEATDEKEVVEEVLILSEPLHRIRTIIWEKADYGRSSRSIKYQERPISKKMMTIIENTREGANEA